MTAEGAAPIASTDSDKSPSSCPSQAQFYPAPEHLNSAGCRIGFSPAKGRGVYAARVIESQTVVEISPVLLFSSTEYAAHGRHTILDDYTFKWRDGRMALALGLGSLFNHSQNPNVSYTLDPDTESIRYTASRKVEEGEELCIYYGHKLSFDAADVVPREIISQDPNDGWGGRAALGHCDEGPQILDAQVLWYIDGNCNDIISEDELPFSRIKLVREDEEDELNSVRTQPAWVLDVPDPRHTATMLNWLKKVGLDIPTMSHLKRIRRQGSKLTALLTLTSGCPGAPVLPDITGLSTPYILQVPSSVALTQISLKHKNTFWPTVYAPRRKGEAEEWSRSRVVWACEAMKVAVQEARDAKRRGELPIAAHVPVPYDKEMQEATQLMTPVVANDTRASSSHPLRHAVLNVIRAVADYRVAPRTPSASTPSPPVADPWEPITRLDPSSSDLLVDSTAVPRNGAHYLLTSLTLFTTHEPCIMCSMALLHSRVKEVFYLIRMESTGGCGGSTCVPGLRGVNHRYNVGRWRDRCNGTSFGEEEGILIDGDVDA